MAMTTRSSLSGALGTAVGEAPANSTLKIYAKLPHGICTTHADIVNADILTFVTA